MIGLVVILFALFGVFEGAMDVLQFKINESIFRDCNQQFWNPKFSWMNKWKDGCPKFGPKFPGSTTVFVFLTDGWHLMKWFRNRMLDIALFIILTRVFEGFWLSFIVVVVIAIIRSTAFELFYSKKPKNDKRSKNA